MSINKDHEFVWYVLNDDTDDEKVFAKEPDAWKEMFKQSSGNRKILRMPAPLVYGDKPELIHETDINFHLPPGEFTGSTFNPTPQADV